MKHTDFVESLNEIIGSFNEENSQVQHSVETISQLKIFQKDRMNEVRNEIREILLKFKKGYTYDGEKKVLA